MKYLLLVLFFLITSCKEKVNCEVLEKKIRDCHDTFDKTFSRSGKTAEKEYNLLLKEMVDSTCKARNGKFGDTKTLNKCIKRESCDEFVQCLFRLPKSRTEEKK